MASSIAYFSTLVLLVFLPLLIAGDLKTTYETQVQKEFLASNTYLTFAHTLLRAGVYPGFAEFFFESAEEEREHGEKLIDFANVLNMNLKLSTINVADKHAKMTELREMIQAATDMEKDVLKQLNDLRTEAENAGNYALVHFVEQEMLEEQATAVKLILDLNQRLARSSSSAVLPQMMDQDLRDKQTKKA